MCGHFQLDGTQIFVCYSDVRRLAKINIAKVSKAHIPPTVAIIGHTTLISYNRIGQIKGLISNMWLILLCTVEIVINDVHTKF